MDRTSTALLTAYDKTHIGYLAKFLKNMGWDLLGSSGTAKYLNERGIECRDIAEIVGSPILGHRVVTLSREIHAALLAQDTPEDHAELARIGVPRIDLVYVDLYPLRDEARKPEATPESVLEVTDVGGPALLRSAAKGRRLVIVDGYGIAQVCAFLNGNRDFGMAIKNEYDFRLSLACRAERAVGEYCSASADFLAEYGLRTHKLPT